jgi:hypothetical protein
MSAFGSPAPKFELFYAAVDKQTGRIAAVGMSAPGVLADAAEKKGLPKDCFELRRISSEEWIGSGNSIETQAETECR